jgi:hypothetical protein
MHTPIDMFRRFVETGPILWALSPAPSPTIRPHVITELLSFISARFGSQKYSAVIIALEVSITGALMGQFNYWSSARH